MRKTADCQTTSHNNFTEKNASQNMWQEILAMDTKFSQNMESQDLRPLYLKRRLQLLQRHQNSCIGKCILVIA